MIAPQWRVRLGFVAEVDFANILKWTTENFGARQAAIYRDTLVRAIGELANGPDVPGSKARDDIMSALRPLHVAQHGPRRSGDPAPLQRLSASRRARRKREPQGANNAHDRTEFGITGLPQRLVEALAIQAGLLRNPTHAACTCNKAKRVTYEIRVTGFERRRNIGNLALFGVEIVGGVKSCCLGHHNVSASL
jgi:plasmid stabilization system protein ParE